MKLFHHQELLLSLLFKCLMYNSHNLHLLSFKTLFMSLILLILIIHKIKLNKDIKINLNNKFIKLNLNNKFIKLNLNNKFIKLQFNNSIITI